MTTAPYHWIIGQHVLDGFQFALSFAPASGAPSSSWILLARGGTACSAALGYAVPWDYNGVSTLLTQPWEQAAVPVSTPQHSCQAVLPPAQAVTAQASVFERLRAHHPAGSFVQVVLSYEHAIDDLPPLQAGDQVTLLWELRETLTTPDNQRLSGVAEKIISSAATFRGLQFYLRQTILTDDLRERQRQIEEVVHPAQRLECVTL